jgi:hypothetical protein
MKRCLVFALLLNCQFAVAGISLNDFSGSESVIDFGNPGSPQIMPNPFTLQGVTFQVGGGGFNVRIDDNSLLTDNIPGASLFGALETGLATAIVRIDFGSLAVNRAGLIASNIDGIATFELRAFNSGGLQLDAVSVTQQATEEAVFLGLETQSQIAYLELQRTASTTFQHSNVIDDVRFEAVPEPSTIALWAVMIMLVAPRFVIKR